MAVTPVGGFFVKSPLCITPSKYGLLSSVTPQTISDPHWQASGIQYEDDLCSNGVVSFIDQCPPASGFTKPAQRDLNFCTADPFIVVGSYDCPPVGRSAAESYEIARRRLLAWEGDQVENALWTGSVDSGSGPTTIQPSLAFGNPDCDILPVDLNPAGALDPVAAIAAIEEALCETVSCGGIIHVPLNVLPYLVRFKMARLTDEGYVTPSGLKIVAGCGYPNSGPANVASAPGESWVFATGPLIICGGR